MHYPPKVGPKKLMAQPKRPCGPRPPANSRRPTTERGYFLIDGGGGVPPVGMNNPGPISKPDLTALN